MPIDIDIAYVARLARLALTDEELQGYGGQLEAILDYAARVQALPTDEVPPTSHPLPMINAHRPDTIEDTLDREEVLSQAPERQGPYFVVPPFLEQG